MDISKFKVVMMFAQERLTKFARFCGPRNLPWMEVAGWRHRCYAIADKSSRHAQAQLDSQVERSDRRLGE
jgi:hypothetical protein